MRFIKRFEDFAIDEGFNPRDLQRSNKESSDIWEAYISTAEGQKYVESLKAADPLWWSNAAINGNAFSSHRNTCVDAVVAQIIKQHGKMDAPVKASLEDILLDIADKAAYEDYKKRKK